MKLYDRFMEYVDRLRGKTTEQSETQTSDEKKMVTDEEHRKILIDHIRDLDALIKRAEKLTK